MYIPRYQKPEHPLFKLGQDDVHMFKIVDFLRYVLKRDHLSINEYLETMKQDPFFLVAATGLGKTVAVPLHVLLRVMEGIGQNPNPQPRVWVVEPRIPIAVDQMAFMNSLWQEYLRKNKQPSFAPLFGCVTSASGRVNPDAPIQFVTTGIFELQAKAGELTPTRDRVIIDEAHVTIEQNPGVELGIALSRKAGVTVDYMSATVDTTTLSDDLRVSDIIRADNQRHVVWKSNLLRPMDEVLPDLVETTLVRPNPRSEYFPQPGEFRQAKEVVSAVLEPGRSHGMLAVVNSYAGEQSDVARLADKLRKRFSQLPVLQLAGEVVRDATKEREFKLQLEQIESRKQNYVILATSVVEMGITFPTLDYVVTMDCGYDQETIGDVTFPVVAPLGVNSLLQRIGRVGRRRPGIAYITNEVGADYAEMEDWELNSGKALRYEPIHFPMNGSPLLPLAYFACGQEWTGLDDWVASLDLPSRLHENIERMKYMDKQVDLLVELGLVDQEYRYTSLGERMERWVGQADLAYAVQLQKRFEEGCDLPELMFWIVTTALSNTPIVMLKARNDFFIDFNEEHVSIPHRIAVWGNYWYEDIAIFNAIALAASMSPRQLLGNVQIDELDEDSFYRWSNHAGIDSRKLLKAGKAIADLWRLFCRINSKTARFKELFGGQKLPDIARFPWAQCVRRLDVNGMQYVFARIPGIVPLHLGANEIEGFYWYDDEGRAGDISQDDTPIRLDSEYQYYAQIVPSRKAKGDETSWRLMHLTAFTRKRTF